MYYTPQFEVIPRYTYEALIRTYTLDLIFAFKRVSSSYPTGVWSLLFSSIIIGMA
jgi:hypothetical protein